MNGIVIAGGGTGGHIYPAVAICQELRRRNPKIAIDFIGTERGLEKKIVPREGFRLHYIKVGALNQVGLFTKLVTLFLLPFAVLQSIVLLIRLRPRVVLGVGGYSSGPVSVAAKLLRIPLAVFESNAYPGLTNRWLAHFVSEAFVNFEITKDFFKHARMVGVPVRSELKQTSFRQPENLKILVFGGSQGALGINKTVFEAIKMGGEWLQNVTIVHQVGSKSFQEYQAKYEELNPTNVQWFEFLYDMPSRYQWADIVFCRAGASTIAELAACGKASVLIPFPGASDNHQQKNAEELAKQNAAVMVLQKEFTPEKFIQLVKDFSASRGLIEQLEKNVRKFFQPQSAQTVADALLKLAEI